jgi:biopolymer transport protein ExbB/TolQ
MNIHTFAQSFVFGSANFSTLAASGFSFNEAAHTLGDACFGFLGLNFAWGLYCVILCWRRTKQLRFRSHQDQEEFLNELLPRLRAGDFDAANEFCEAKSLRALPRLVLTVIANRKIGYEALREQIGELIQRDLMGPLEQKMGWVATTIKSGPLLGLFGTVLSMIAAFGRIGTGEKVAPHMIAHDISIALICTALGLATAIPFSYLLANLNIKTRELLESVGSGMTHVLGCFRPSKNKAVAHAR